MAGLLCDVIECIGCYYIIGALCNKSRGQPATQGLCGCDQNQQQNNTGVYSNAPQRQQFDSVPVAPVSRGAARYERTSNVLGSKQIQQPPPPTGPAPSSSINGTGYRLSDGAPINRNNQYNSSDYNPPPAYNSSHYDNNVPVPTTTAAVVGAHQSNNHTNLTLTEQLQSMPAYTVTLIKKILMNAIDSRNDIQKRRIKLSNDKIQSQIVNVDGAIDILTHAGFIVGEINTDTQQVVTNTNNNQHTDTYLIFPDSGDKQKMNETLQYLNAQRPDVPAVTAKTL